MAAAGSPDGDESALSEVRQEASRQSPVEQGHQLQKAARPAQAVQHETRPGRYWQDVVKVEDEAATHGLGHLLLEGRFSSRSKDESLLFEWPLSTIRGRFEGQSIAAKLQLLNGIQDYYSVRLDGGPPRTVVVNASQGIIMLFDDLPPGPHEVQITKRTESYAATAEFSGFELGRSGRMLQAPEAKTRRIEIIGDSISAGFGNECASKAGRYSPRTQNADESFGAIAGRALDAEVRIIAWSGKGLYKNSDGSRRNTIPQLWNRTLPTWRPDEKWVFSQWHPDVVVLNLMTNDFSVPPAKPQQLRQAWKAFLTRIRHIYPKASIILTLGPMLSDDWPPEYPGCLTEARNVLLRVVRDLNSDKIVILEFPQQYSLDLPIGCQGHPGVQIHRVMGEQLTNAIREVAGWQ